MRVNRLLRRVLTRAGLGALTVVGMGIGSADAAQCSFSTTSVNFGVYNVFAASPNDSVGMIRYECNGGARDVIVAITAGGSGTFGPRTLVHGTEALAYNLFRDAARTSVWGDGTGGSQPMFLGNPPNKQEQTLTIYGRIPPAQDVRAGSYSDSIAVVILY